jgi:hypothetical protein
MFEELKEGETISRPGPGWEQAHTEGHGVAASFDRGFWSDGARDIM